MGYTPQLSLPVPSLAGLSFKRQVSLLKRTGFSGIELFMFPYAVQRLARYQAIAKEADMRLSLHQPWSYTEGQVFLNRILDAVGFLPKDGYRLEPIVRNGNGELFVTYCDRLDEAKALGKTGSPVMIAFQTACAWKGSGESRTHRVSYQWFVEHILPTDMPIVFDTFHVLEWQKGKAGGKSLASYNTSEIAEQLLYLWRQIGAKRVVEIHWNDFIADSRKGGGNDGRACLPGEGILAKGLRLLAFELKRDGWRGAIVPELSPFSLFPYSVRKLIALRLRMEQFFA